MFGGKDDQNSIIPPQLISLNWPQTRQIGGLEENTFLLSPIVNAMRNEEEKFCLGTAKCLSRKGHKIPSLFFQGNSP